MQDMSPQKQQRRLSSARLIRLFSWYVVFPGFIITSALLSLRDLPTSISSDAAVYPNLQPPKKKDRMQKLRPTLPGMHNPNTSFRRYIAKDTDTTTASNNQDGDNKMNDDVDDYAMPEDTAQQQQQPENWWENLPVLGNNKPSHPEFLKKIEDARHALEHRSKEPNRTALPNVASWKPVPTPLDQPVNFTSHILPPPRIIGNDTNIVAILVLSGQHNFDKRQAIRETWGRDHSNLYFVIGQSNCDEREGEDEGNESTLEEAEEAPPKAHDELGARRRRRRRLQVQEETKDNSTKPLNATAPGTPKCIQSDHSFLLQEQLKYKDLLEIPMKEHYRLLPEKVIQAYHWVLHHMPNIEWIVKADDDMFVRIDSLEHYLRKYNSNIPMLLGKIVPFSPVSRQGKWAEVDYEADFYPYWSQGSAGHVVSRATAKYIVDTSPTLHRYQGEDVSIGIWLDNARKSQRLSHVTYIQAKRMITNEGTKWCGCNKYMMIGHGLSPDEVYDCFLKFGNRTFTENAWLDDPAEFENQVGWGFDSSIWNSGAGSPAGSSFFAAGGALASAGSSSRFADVPIGKSIGYRGGPSILYNKKKSNQR
jgi:hypothetical protein